MIDAYKPIDKLTKETLKVHNALDFVIDFLSNFTQPSYNLIIKVFYF